MPYIGGQPTANFVDIPSVERFNGNNSTTSFTLSRTVGNDQDIVVSVDGVIQDTNKYSVSGTTLSFSTAPSTGTGNITQFTTTNGSATVSVNEPNHGRSTSDTVRFRNTTNVGNVSSATITNNAGYTITKVNDNSYTFVSGVTASSTLKGGGGLASAGPVTVTA